MSNPEVWRKNREATRSLLTDVHWFNSSSGVHKESIHCGCTYLPLKRVLSGKRPDHTSVKPATSFVPVPWLPLWRQSMVHLNLLLFHTETIYISRRSGFLDVIYNSWVDGTALEWSLVTHGLGWGGGSLRWLTCCALDDVTDSSWIPQGHCRQRPNLSSYSNRRSIIVPIRYCYRPGLASNS